MSDSMLSCRGRIGKETRAIQTKTGNAMAVATVAVDLPIAQSEDTSTLWLQLTAFGHNAELLARHEKGEWINAMGRLQINRWRAKDGTEREGWALVVDSLLSARSTRPGGGKSKTAPASGTDARQLYGNGNAGAEPFNDDIPF